MINEITKLKADIDRLSAWNDELKKEIEEHKEWNASTKAENQNLRRENLELKEKIADFRQLIRAIQFQTTFEDWLTDDEDDE